MLFLNLDKDFKPFKGQEIQFENFIFSGGEPHIKLHCNFDIKEDVTITQRIKSFNDFGLLCLAVDALKRLGIKIINLFIPYFPSARQDRLMVRGEALSVKVYADIINSMNLNKVTIYDPHSEVTPALINNCEVISNHSFIQKVIEQIGENTLLISPDGGALKKIYKLSEFLGGFEIIECSKVRNIKTGELSGFKAYADNLEGKSCLIVDDICDGGGTFIGLADELKNKNISKLYLAVSHGIFSKGFDELNKHFTQIFTTDSFKTINQNNVVQLKLQNGLLS